MINSGMVNLKKWWMVASVTGVIAGVVLAVGTALLSGSFFISGLYSNVIALDAKVNNIDDDVKNLRADVTKGFDKIDAKFDEVNETLRNIAVDVAILNKSSNNASNTESTEKIASSQ